MKKDSYVFFLKNMASFARMDIRFFDNGEETFSSLFYDKENFIFNYYKKTLFSLSDNTPTIFDSSLGISFAVLPYKNSLTIVGPVLTLPYEMSSAASLSHTSAFDGISTEDALNILSDMPYIPIIKLTVFSDAIYSVLTDNIISIRKTNDDNTTNEPPQKQNVLEKIDSITISYDFERALSTAVMYGITDKIGELVSPISPRSFTGDIGILSTSSLRQTQNMLEVLVTICSRAAISGGLPPSIAYSLSDKFMIAVEKMPEQNDFSIGYELIVAFTNAVKSYRLPESSNYIIKRAQKYIDSHLFSSLSLASVSSVLNLNKNYLSSIFKREMGMTITEYIACRKINYAKYLLDTTELSLSEIAYRLSFSSQSAFSNTFKKVTSKTPKAFRLSLK